MDLPGWAQIIIAVAALLGAWQVIWKRGLLPLYTAARIWERVAEEFSPNGGNSMRDQIDKIRDTVTEIDRRWEERSGKLDLVAAKLDDHLARAQWWQERDRITSLLETQALTTAAVFEVLSRDGSPLAQQISRVLQNAIEQTNPPA